jgi:hypothetical protein
VTIPDGTISRLGSAREYYDPRVIIASSRDVYDDGSRSYRFSCLPAIWASSSVSSSGSIRLLIYISNIWHCDAIISWSHLRKDYSI